MLVKPPVLAIANPETPALLLASVRLVRVERDDDDGRLDALESSFVLRVMRDNFLPGLYISPSVSELLLAVRVSTRRRLLAHLGPDIAVRRGESADRVRVCLGSRLLDDFLEKTVSRPSSVHSSAFVETTLRPTTHASSSFSLSHSPDSSTTGTS